MRNKIREIETSYLIETFRGKHLNFWLDIRTRIFFLLAVGKESNLVINQKLYWNTIKNFSYGFFNWFRKYDAWFFSSNANRVLISGKWHDRLFEFPAKRFDRSLFLELTVSSHHKRSLIASSHIVSRSFLIVLEKLIGLFVRSKKEHHELILEISEKYNLNFDPSYNVKKMTGQYFLMKFLLRITKPKYAFLAPSYTNFGYIKALKEKGVKVIEAQHGVINKDHFGYNYFFEFSDLYKPDYLLTFGKSEAKVFKEQGNFFTPSQIFPVGSYIIDEKIRTFSRKKNDSKTFVISLQDCSIGSKIIPFMRDVATRMPQFEFIFKPRRTLVSEYMEKYDFPSNLRFEVELDVYQLMIEGDIHVTAYSSCAVEAPAMGIRNILIDIEGKASEYFGEILSSQETTFYVSTVNEFINLAQRVEILPREKVKSAHQDILVKDYRVKMESFLMDELKIQE